MTNFNSQYPQQPGQPQQPYGASPTAPQGGQYQQPHRGTLILVLGILGFVCCVICGIIAWVMGNNDLKAMDAGRMDPSGRGLTNAGRICGMISVIWQVFVIILGIVLLASGVFTSMMEV